MIMTAVEFEIETPERPEEATFVANTEKLDQVMPALDDIGADATPMGGVPGGGRGDRSPGGGLLDSIKGALGLGGDETDTDRIATAEALTAEYAERLQTRLEEHDKWTSACEAAAAGSATAAGDVSSVESGDEQPNETETVDSDDEERSTEDEDTTDRS
jgi:hypothetical protein